MVAACGLGVDISGRQVEIAYESLREREIHWELVYLLAGQSK